MPRCTRSSELQAAGRRARRPRVRAPDPPSPMTMDRCMTHTGALRVRQSSPLPRCGVNTRLRRSHARMSRHILPRA